MKRCKTAGGAFNPAERGVYFMASAAPDRFNALRGGGYSGVPVHAPIHRHILVSVHGMNETMEDTMTAYTEAGGVVFIDSGVFTLTNDHVRAHGGTMDEALALPPEEIDGFDKLFEKYVDVCTRWGDRCWGYTELDQGGRANKVRTRARLEGLGLQPIPIYHPLNDGWDYFDELAEQYDRIAFGNVVQADARTRLRLVATVWERRRKYPHLWVHLLGLTPSEVLNAYPLDSCDSSTWLSPVRWGVLHPRAMLKSLGTLTGEYSHPIGGGAEGERGQDKATIVAGLSLGLEVRGWGHHLDRLASLGVDWRGTAQ